MERQVVVAKAERECGQVLMYDGVLGFLLRHCIFKKLVFMEDLPVLYGCEAHIASVQ